MKSELNLNWLKSISVEHNQLILKEYRYLVHRFTLWMGLTISKTENEVVRQLILPNFVEESGSINGAKSHLKMLDDLIHSVGIEKPVEYTPSAETKRIEQTFYSIYDEGDTYKSLCVLGPSTEAISHQFLQPLSDITLKNFPKADTAYFDTHLSEVEDEHAIAIEKAISIMEEQDLSLILNKGNFINLGFNLHREFWKNIEQICESQTSSNRKDGIVLC